MEYKLVEYCKTALLQKSFLPFVRRQIHRSNIKKDKSGMICSGEQTVAFFQLSAADLPAVQQILDCLRTRSEGWLLLHSGGLQYGESGPAGGEQFVFSQENKDWRFAENLGFCPRLYIAGGGHVSLALSRLAGAVGFSVHVLDDRSGLNTIPGNEIAGYTQVAGYAEIAGHIPEGDQTYVVLMSFGYRTDKIILKQLLGRRYKYLGMMGSAAKVETLFRELSAEGADRLALGRVRAPAGLPIRSQTPEEIAVSILAEMIRVKNADKP